jgi:UDP-GlcNAc:undecaprenyl-phosphate/decaprenyl-phosphate GlcNAc-1-phosphate transferase
MQPYLPIILASGLLAFLVTPFTRVLARRLGMLDQPGLRKGHQLPVPLLGGLAIYLALAVAFITFGSRDWLAEGMAILGGATVLFLTGLWDDRYGMPAWVKLAAQVVAAFVVMAVGVRVGLLGNWWLDGLITLVWIVGITNAVNLLDNMDGLAAGTTAVAAVFFFVMAALEGQGLVASLAAALFGASLGFLFYNFAPAVSFMGDSGSLTLGFLLSVIAIKIRFINYPLAATWMAPIIVLGVLIFDTTLVSLSRLRRGRSIFQGGTDHTSHRLAQLGLGQPRAVFTLYLVAAGLGAAAIVVTRLPPLMANAVFGALLALGFVALAVLERVEPRFSGDPRLVVIPGGGGMVEAVQAAGALSRDVVLLLAPRRFEGEVRPTRDEVVEVLAALAEEPAAARRLLARAMSAAWWEDLSAMNGALRLNGLALAVGGQPIEGMPADAIGAAQADGDPALMATIRRARLIVLGPGDPEVNVAAVLSVPGVRAALQQASGRRVWAGSAAGQATLEAWLGESTQAISAAPLEQFLQSRLLQQAVGHAKTRLS